jgi:hypothetical protein
MREIVSPLYGLRSPFGPLIDPHKVQGKRPPLVLDFDAERYRTGGAEATFSSAITHAATTNATMVDSDGLLKWRPHNLVLRSEEFDNAAWVSVNSTITADAAASPDGSTTADLFVPSTSNVSNHIVRQSVTLAAAKHTWSVFAKAAGYDWVRLVHVDGDVATYSAYFDLANGTVGTVDAGATATIQDFGNGWYKCSVTPDAAGSASPAQNQFVYAATDDADHIFAGDGTSGVYLWGAHLYRSDRGGMVPAADGSTYVATTDTAVEPVRVDAEGGVGEVCWRPHNLCLQSEDFGTDAGWAWTRSTVTENQTIAPDGSLTADYLEQEPGNTSAGAVGRTVTISGSGTYTWAVFAKAAEKTHVRVQLTGSNYAYFDVESGTAGAAVGCTTSITDYGNGWHLCAISAALSSNPFALVYGADSESLLVVGSGGIYFWGAHLYRSDLGGMVNNPDRGDSYVPTSSAALYLPRRGHHVYDGSSWVNEGILHESEARTNLLTYSEDFTDAAWFGLNTATLAIDATGPDGETSAVTLADSGATGSGSVSLTETVTVATSTAYTFSVFAKADQLSWVALQARNFTTPSNGQAFFNLSDGTVGTTDTGYTASVQDFGNGWYRCSITFTTDASDTSGALDIRAATADTNAACDLDGTSSILVYGAQFEAGPTPSSYIPTVGSTVERAAETLTIPAANLPWPTPNVIGEELVTNGTFDADSDWLKTQPTSGSVTISGGVGTVDSQDGSYAALTQTVSVESGKVYKITFDITVVAGSAEVGIGGDAVFFKNNITTSGSYEVFWVADRASFTLEIKRLSGAVFPTTFSIDNISVREINPLAVSIQMDGRVTYADTDAVTEFAFLRWEANSSNRIFHVLNTVLTRTGRVDITQVEAGVFDAISSSDAAYAPGVLVPFNIASRHGSTFINAAIDGTAVTANTTPVALADLSSTNLILGTSDYNGTIKTFRVWAADLGDAGIEEAST